MSQLEKIKANFKAIKASWEVNKGGFPLTEERKELINAFTGWGGCGAILYPIDKDWKKLSNISKDNLSCEKEVKKGYKYLCDIFGNEVVKEIWQSMKTSALTAFYTPEEIPDTFFKNLKEQNPHKERIEVLDPCVGGGVYIDACLKHFPKAKITGVEKDFLTSFLLTAKYKNDENVTIHRCGFEEVKFKNKKFDVVASNIPFGDFKVGYTQGKYDNIFTSRIHNFFFYHSQNLLKENGLLCFITSTGVMNSPENSPIREELVKSGDILDVQVLPNNTFESTSVASHIVTFLKTNEKQNEKEVDELLVNTEIDKNGVRLNKYIATHIDSCYIEDPIVSKNQYGDLEYTSKSNDFNHVIENLDGVWKNATLELNTRRSQDENNELELLSYPRKLVSSLNTKQSNLMEEIQFIRKGEIPNHMSEFQVVATIRGKVNAEKKIPLVTIATGIVNNKKVYYVQSNVDGISFSSTDEQWFGSEDLLETMDMVFSKVQEISQEHQIAISLDARRDVTGERFTNFFKQNYKHVQLEYGYTKEIDFHFHRQVQENDVFVTKKGNIAQILEIEKIYANVDGEFPQKRESYKVKQLEVDSLDKERLVALLQLYSDYNVFIEKHTQYKKGVEWKLEQLEQARDKINQSYDNFVSKYGNINESNKTFLNKYNEIIRDIIPVLKGLEVPQTEVINPDIPAEGDNLKDTFAKAGIFSYDYEKDFNEEVTTDVALVKSFSIKGKIDIPFIAQLTNKDESSILEELEEIIIKNPLNDEYELRESFLHGDMYKKRAAIQELPDSAEKEAALDFLEEHFPEQIAFYEIKYQFGSRWMPLDIFKSFIEQQTKTEFELDYNKEVDALKLAVKEYTINREHYLRKKLENDRYFTSSDIIKHAFYGTYPEITKTKKWVDENGKKQEKSIVLAKDTAYCKRQIDNFKQEFIKYVNNLPEKEKERIVNIYNQNFNYLAKNVETKNNFFKLGINTENLGIKKEYPHQVEGVWKMLLNGGGIIDHEVGYGKTISLIALAHNLKKFGKAKLPIILGLPANVAEIAKRYQQAYPQDRILYAGKNEFSPENRELFFNLLRNNEYDAVIMSHEQFKKIPISDEIYIKELEDEIRKIELNMFLGKEYGVSKKNLNELEKKIESKRAEFAVTKERLESGKSKNIPHIGNLGIDHVIVDESHNFKNGDFSTRHTRTKGIGNTEGSERTKSLKMAIRTIQKNNNSDYGATFFSGTPISNSLSELYTLQNILTPNILEEKGLANFDAWASAFMLKSQEMETNIVGEATITERFRMYMNVPELSRMYNAMTHTMRGDSEMVQRPKQDVKMLVNELTPRQKVFNAKLLELLKSEGDEKAEEALHLEEPLKRDKEGYVSALALAVTNLALNSSIDLRTIDKTAPDDPNSKVNWAIADALDRYKRYDEMKGAQIIFCDRGTSKKKLTYEEMDYNYNHNIFTSTYDDIKYKLMKSGVPEQEIAFIQDYDSDKKKMELSKLMNEGKIRFLIGGIQKAGTGINVQKRLCGVTHLTLPWRPSDLEQANGRIFRAGNEMARKMNNNRCEITMCATQGTLDNYKVEFIKRKLHFIDQIRVGANSNVRILDEGELGEDMALDLATLQAELAGDQTILEKAKVDKELDELNKNIEDFDIQRLKAQDTYNKKSKERDEKAKIISYIERDIAKAESLIQYKGDKKINAPVVPELGELYNDETLAAYFRGKINDLITKNIGSSLKVGELYGFDMVYKRSFKGVVACLISQEAPKMEYENTYVDNFYGTNKSDTVICNSFINCFNFMEKRLKDNRNFFEKYDTEAKSASLELKETLPLKMLDRQKELSQRKEELEIKLKETGGLRTKAEYKIIEEIDNGKPLSILQVNDDIKELDRAILYSQFGKEDENVTVYISDKKILDLFQNKFNGNGIIVSEDEPIYNEGKGWLLNFTIKNLEDWYEAFYYEFNEKKAAPIIKIEPKVEEPQQNEKQAETKKTVQFKPAAAPTQPEMSNNSIYKADKNGQYTLSFDNLGNIPQPTTKKDVPAAEEEEVKKAVEEIRKPKAIDNEPTVYEEGEEVIPQEEAIKWQAPSGYEGIPNLKETDRVYRHKQVIYKAFFIPNIGGAVYLNELDPNTGTAYGLYALGNEEAEFREFSLQELLDMGAKEVELHKQTYEEVADEELYLNFNENELKELFFGEIVLEKDKWKYLTDEIEEALEPQINTEEKKWERAAQYQEVPSESVEKIEDKQIYKVFESENNLYYLNKVNHDTGEGWGLVLNKKEPNAWAGFRYFNIDELMEEGAKVREFENKYTYTEPKISKEICKYMNQEAFKEVFNNAIPYESTLENTRELFSDVPQKNQVELSLEKRKVYRALETDTKSVFGKSTFYLNGINHENAIGYGLVLSDQHKKFMAFDVKQVFDPQSITRTRDLNGATYEELVETELKGKLTDEELNNIFKGKLSFNENRIEIKRGDTLINKKTGKEYEVWNVHEDRKSIELYEAKYANSKIKQIHCVYFDINKDFYEEMSKNYQFKENSQQELAPNEEQQQEQKPQEENQSFLIVKKTDNPYERTLQAKTKEGKAIDIITMTKNVIVPTEDGIEIIPQKYEEEWGLEEEENNEEEKEDIKQGKKPNF